MNKSQYIRNLKVLDKRADALSDAIHLDAEYLKARLNKENADAAYNTAINNYRAKIQPELDKIKKEMDAVSKAFRNSVEVLTLSPKLTEWFKKFKSGLDGVSNWKIIWKSNDERFVVIKMPGGTHWSGIGQRSYSPTKYYGCDTSKCQTYLAHCGNAFSGRYSKKKMDAFAKEFFAL